MKRRTKQMIGGGGLAGLVGGAVLGRRLLAARSIGRASRTFGLAVGKLKTAQAVTRARLATNRAKWGWTNPHKSTQLTRLGLGKRRVRMFGRKLRKEARVLLGGRR